MTNEISQFNKIQKLQNSNQRSAVRIFMIFMSITKTIGFLIIFFLQIGVSQANSKDTAVGEKKTAQATLAIEASTKSPLEKTQSENSLLPIYSRHWFDSTPWFSKKENILLAHHIFFISFNVTTGFPDWVAYELTPHIVWGNLKAERTLKSDPLLAKALKNPLVKRQVKIPLSFKDYKGASSFGYDKGHLAPKGSFKGSLFAFEAQYMTNIVPQNRDLNQGPWKTLEEQIRQLVLRGNSVKILTGPVYGEALGKKPFRKPLAVWPKAQGKISQVPTGFWKMIFMKEKSLVKVCTFLMPQDLGGYKRKTSPKKFIVKIKELQQFLPLNFQNINHLKEDCRFL